MNHQSEQLNSSASAHQQENQHGAFAFRHRLNRFRLIDLQHRIQQAFEESYATWRQRFAERGQALLDEAKLNREILPNMLDSAVRINITDSTDLAARLATLLRGCSDDQCGSFASFSPELANFVALFEAAYRGRQGHNFFHQGGQSLSAIG